MILLSVVAAIASLFGGGDVQAGGVNARAITIVESSHRIEFPDRIVFTLEADAPPRRTIRHALLHGGAPRREGLYLPRPVYQL